jgi:hypothetical protein
MGTDIHHGPPSAHPLPVPSNVLQMVRVALRAPLVLAPRRSLRCAPTGLPAQALPRIVRLAQRKQLLALPALEQEKHLRLHALAFPERAGFFAGSPRRGMDAIVGRSPIGGSGLHPRPSSVSLASIRPVWPIRPVLAHLLGQISADLRGHLQSINDNAQILKIVRRRAYARALGKRVA